MDSTGAEGRWGQSGVPLAPWWLRDELEENRAAQEAMGGAESRLTRSQLGSTSEQRMKPKSRDSTSKVRNRAAKLIRDSPEILELPLIQPGHRIDEECFKRIEFTTRTRNVLRRRGLLDHKGRLKDRARLEQTTLGEALLWRSFGVTSLVELCTCLEFASRKSQDVEEARESRSEASAMQTADAETMPIEEWMGFVYLDDPRLGEEVARPWHERTVREALQSVPPNTPWLAAAIAQARSLVDSLDELPLDKAISDFLSAATGLTGDRLEALCGRLGLTTEDPLTLQEAGDIAGLTRERIRQLQGKLNDKIEDLNPVYMPKLDAAIALLSAAVPIRVEGAREAIKQEGFDVSPEFILRSARLCNRKCDLRIAGDLLLSSSQTQIQEGDVQRVVSVARSLAHKTGASNIDHLVKALNDEGIEVTIDEAELIVGKSPQFNWLKGWFWIHPPRMTGTFNTIIRKTLSINQPQTVRSIREALRRRLTFKKVEPVPPISVIRSILHSRTDLRVDGDKVYSLEDLALAEHLGKVERKMIEILNNGPDGILTRSELMQRCYEADLKMTTATVYTTYNPCIEHIAPGLWSARGNPIHPVAVESARKRLDRDHEPAIKAGGWTQDGSPWFAFEITVSNVAGPVATVDTSIRRVLQNKSFPLRTLTEVKVGQVSFSDEGASAWGFSKSINVLGAEPGDLLHVEVDLVNKRASIRLDSPEALEAARRA